MALQTTDKMTRTYVVGLVMLGFLTFLLSRIVDRGFFHGLFQGMTIALMFVAAYLFGQSFRRGRAGEQDDLWRPSQDEK